MKKQIVFWLPQGRLGNLIFQYQAALSLFPEECRIISLETEFNSAFETNKNFKFIALPKLPKIKGLLLKSIRWCANKGILSSVMLERDVINRKYQVESCRLVKKMGWIPWLCVLEGWFQHDHYALPRPVIKEAILNTAEEKLAHIPHERRVAVHLRFGDYEHWSIMDKKGVCLPMSYYNETMERLAMQLKDPVFVIFSDDSNRAERELGNKHSTYYFDGKSPSEDIAGITRCSHAIISASTFSWWGAYLINTPERTIIAPKYWAGFKSSIWYPIDIQTDAFIYVDVPTNQQP